MKKKSNLWTIARKEFARFFKDKSMVFSTILLPGLMIYFLYTFMGGALKNMYSVDDDFSPVVYLESDSEVINTMLEQANFSIMTCSDEKTVEDVKNDLQNKDSGISLLILLPANFDEDVAAYDNLQSTDAAPNIEVYYNSASTQSSSAMDMLTDMLDQYEQSMANKFDINNGDSTYDMATKEDSTGQIFASMLPMLMMIFMFSGCMALAPESIAGEKERGTMATLLITPLKRSELAIGKIVSLGCISLLSGLSSFIGTFASLPNLMGGASDAMDINIYGVKEFGLLFLVILSTVLVIIGLICIISTWAKSVKQAGTMISPLMIVTMLIGITAMFGNGAPSNTLFYLIPLYNSVQSMVGIFLFDYNMVNVLVSIISNVCYMGICAFVLTKMFNSEKVIFNK